MFYKNFYNNHLKRFFEKVFSVKNYCETHKILTFMWIKIKFPKPKFYKAKKKNLYYYYKKNNLDITTLPPAKGQIRDIQLANLALLRELDYVCKENGLVYWLDGGTLLGAVRHKGFIPWDDDIDTAMLREDYEKIIDAFKKSSRNPNIFAGYVRDHNNNFIIKVQHKKCPHLFVDIFPFVKYGPAMTTDEQIELSKTIKQLRKSLNAKIDKIANNNELNAFLIKTEKEEILTKQLPSKDEETDLVWGINYNQGYTNWFTNYNVIFPLQKLNFEGMQYSCANKPHDFLTRLYGNYMAYPKKIGFGHNMYKKISKEEQKVINSLIESLD